MAVDRLFNTYFNILETEGYLKESKTVDVLIYNILYNMVIHKCTHKNNLSFILNELDNLFAEDYIKGECISFYDMDNDIINRIENLERNKQNKLSSGGGISIKEDNGSTIISVSLDKDNANLSEIDSDNEISTTINWNTI